MRLLLDTHVVLWWLGGSPDLADELAELLRTEPDVFVSAASVWEAAIKQASGKLAGPPDLPELMRSDFAELDVTGRHTIEAARLPPLHRDPFDRVLVAQARLEGLTLVTRDAAVRAYDVPVMPA